MPPKKRGYYTAEEVAEHNTEKSLWVIMNRKVYDVTVFHKRHPGGAAVLRQMGGRDATAAATAAHKTILPGNLMWEFCIGSIVRNKKPEVLPKAGGEVVPKAKASSTPVAAVQTLPARAPTPSGSPPLPPPAEAPPPLVPSATAVMVPAVAPKAATSSTLPNSVAKAKAKAKAKSQVEVERTESKTEKLTEVASASSGSKSVQGSVDGDAGNNSPDSDSEQTDTEFNGTMEFLYDKMSSDPELSRWVVKSEKNELLFEVRRFLGALLESSDIRRSGSFFRKTHSEQSPKGKVTKGSRKDMKDFRIRLDQQYGDFADIMIRLMRRPFPLGEDMFVANLGALSKAIGSESDDHDNAAIEYLKEFCKEKQIEKFAAAMRMTGSTQDDEETRAKMDAAAARIQSVHRGKVGREQVRKNKKEHMNSSIERPEQEASCPILGLGSEERGVEDHFRMPVSEIAKHDGQAIAWLCNCLSDGGSRSEKLREA